jgi:hypothetical protein
MEHAAEFLWWAKDEERKALGPSAGRHADGVDSHTPTI